MLDSKIATSGRGHNNSGILVLCRVYHYLRFGVRRDQWHWAERHQFLQSSVVQEVQAIQGLPVHVFELCLKSVLQTPPAKSPPTTLPVPTTAAFALLPASTLPPSATPPPTHTSPTPPQPIPPSTTLPTPSRHYAPMPIRVSFSHSLHSSGCCSSFASSVSLSSVASMAPPCP